MSRVCGVRSYKNLASEIVRPRSVTLHVSRNLDASNETHQGLPDGTQGYLAACYRNIVDTKSSRFSESNPESYLKSNRKPEKSEMDRTENLIA